MIKLPIKSRISSDVQGQSYVNVSEPDKLSRALTLLSLHNRNRLSLVHPKDTNRFTTMYFNPLLTLMKSSRKTNSGPVTVKYIEGILKEIGDVGIKYATIAEIASRVTTSVKEADAFMSTITKESPLLLPFDIKTDKDDKQVNLSLFAFLAGTDLPSETAKSVIDGLTFPKEGIGPFGDAWSISAVVASFIARPARPLTSSEVMNHVDDILAFYTLAEEIKVSPAKGGTNCALALHIILDTYLSLLMPASSAMSVLHQELAGQSSIVSLDVIRRITSSFATVSLAAYTAVPTLRMLHMAELAKSTTEALGIFIPQAEITYRSTYQTLELMGTVNQMVVPYLHKLHESAGSFTTLSGSDIITGTAKPMPAVLRKQLDPVPTYDVLGPLEGALPLDAMIPFKIKNISRSNYFEIAAQLEKQMSDYRSHVLNFNVMVAEYFRKAEIGLLPDSLPDQHSIMGATEVSTEYATPFSSPSSVRPVKYKPDGNWTLSEFVNRPYNLNHIIKQIITDQDVRFVFANNGTSALDLGGTQGARFLTMPIPGCYSAFTERYTMSANITTFLDLLSHQAVITTRDKFFQDLVLLMMYSKETDDFVHLFRAIAPYFQIDFKYSKPANDEPFNDYVSKIKAGVTAWGYPISVLDEKMGKTSVSTDKLGYNKVAVTVNDPSNDDSLSVTFRLRSKFPPPESMTLIRVSAIKKMVVLQYIADSLLPTLEVAQAIASEALSMDLADLPYSISTPIDALIRDSVKDKIDIEKIDWLHNSSFYHETAYAPHISLQVSRSFSDAFAYSASDIKNLLSYSLIVANDSEGFSQVFAKREFNPVMVLMEDEELSSFPASNAKSSNAPVALAPKDTVAITEHTDEQSIMMDPNLKPNSSPPAKLIDESDSTKGGDDVDDITGTNLVTSLKPDTSDTRENKKLPLLTDEERKAEEFKKLKKKKAADEDAANFDSNTLQPKE